MTALVPVTLPLDRPFDEMYVRRPKVHPPDARGLDRSDLGAFLFAAERFDHAHAALAVLLGLNGLRVSEACSTDIAKPRIRAGHRTLRIVGNGSKPAVIPLVPKTARTIDLASFTRRRPGALPRNAAEMTRFVPRAQIVVATSREQPGRDVEASEVAPDSGAARLPPTTREPVEGLDCELDGAHEEVLWS